MGVAGAGLSRCHSRRRCVSVVLALVALTLCGCGRSSLTASVVEPGVTQVAARSTLCESAPLALGAPVDGERPGKCVGGAYVIAYDHVPEGAEFAIIGQRYTVGRRDYLWLTVGFLKPGEVELGGGGSAGTVGLEGEDQEGCEGRPFAIFDGLLTEHAAGVVLRGAGKAFKTYEAALPAALHTSGVLVYGTAASPTLAVELNGLPVSESSGHPGPCSRWDRGRSERARIERVTARTARCLRGRGFTLRPPAYASSYLVARRECSENSVSG